MVGRIESFIVEGPFLWLFIPGFGALSGHLVGRGLLVRSRCLLRRSYRRAMGVEDTFRVGIARYRHLLSSS